MGWKVRIGPRRPAVHRSLELRIADHGAPADVASVTRTKGLLVAAVLVLAIAPGATASPAHSTSWKTWCVEYGMKLPPNSLATSLICPKSTAVRAPHKKSQLSPLDRQVASAINQFRKTHGLPLLHVAHQLNAASRQHSKEMGSHGYFDHNSADGTVWWKRIQHYYPQTGYRYWTVGENLVYSSPDISAATAMKMWIGSPEHLANLMNPSWRNLGVASVHVAMRAASTAAIPSRSSRPTSARGTSRRRRSASAGARSLPPLRERPAARG